MEKHGENVKFFYAGLPPWARGVLLVGIFAVVVYVGVTIKNQITDAANAKAQNQVAVDAANDLKGLAQQGIVPSYQSSQYESWAQAIVQAIGGCLADLSSVQLIFQQMKNQADILQLITTFGIRPCQPCGFSTPISYVQYMFNNNAFGGSLPYLLQWAFSSSDLAKLNSTLTAQGITYQFS